MYRCEAATINGFVQQLAVCYLGRGYFFYVAGAIPAGVAPESVDEKLVKKYDIDISKWARYRRRQAGISGIQYIRFDRFFLLLSTEGAHKFFTEEGKIWDVRRRPIRFAGYSIAYRSGRDGKGHPSVRIDGAEYGLLKRKILAEAFNRSSGSVLAHFGFRDFAAYAPVVKQFRQLLRGVNRIRKQAALEEIPLSVIPRHRKTVRPFG